METDGEGDTERVPTSDGVVLQSDRCDERRVKHIRLWLCMCHERKKRGISKSDGVVECSNGCSRCIPKLGWVRVEGGTQKWTLEWIRTCRRTGVCESARQRWWRGTRATRVKRQDGIVSITSGWQRLDIDGKKEHVVDGWGVTVRLVCSNAQGATSVHCFCRRRLW